MNGTFFIPSNKNPKSEESPSISNVFLSILIDYTQYKIDASDNGDVRTESKDGIAAPKVDAAAGKDLVQGEKSSFMPL